MMKLEFLEIWRQDLAIVQIVWRARLTLQVTALRAIFST